MIKYMSDFSILTTQIVFKGLSTDIVSNIVQI